MTSPLPLNMAIEVEIERRCRLRPTGELRDECRCQERPLLEWFKVESSRAKARYGHCRTPLQPGHPIFAALVSIRAARRSTLGGGL
jgi:hypothetical protein